MGAPSEHTKAKAVVGYIALLLVLLLTLFFIYKNVNTLTRVQESTSLRTDSISSLVREKDMKLLELIESVSLLNEDLIVTSQDLDKLLETKSEAYVQRNVLTKSDTVVTKPKKKKFFRRLAEAFVPSKSDSTIQVTRSVEMAVDTIYGGTPQETDQAVKEIQNKIRREKQAHSSRKKRAEELKNLNDSITDKIDLFLVEYEQQRIEDLIAQIEEADESRQKATYWIGAIAVIAVFLAVFFCLLLLRDINQRNRYRRALEKSNKRAADLLQAREKLMLTITHDIKAPVGTIMGYSELMSKTNLTGEQREFLDNMNTATNHVFKLVYDLLDYHSLDLDKADIKRVSFKLDTFVDEVYQSFVPQFKKQGITFVKEGSKEELQQWITSDPIRLKQILNNLISNALKFTEHGSVKLGVSLTPQQVIFQVSDTGFGMNQEELNKIFQEFTRLTSAQGKEGFGLGLSIVSKIINRLGGSIDVESVLNEGTTFTVTLPVVISDSETIREKAQLDFPKGTRILLMDDDKIQLDLTTITLKKRGAEVYACNHLNQLLDALKEQSFDLLITDIQMPEINGFDLVELLRNSNYVSFQTIPILAVSARDQVDVAAIIDHGFIGILKKPFTAYEVISKYLNYLNGEKELNRIEDLIVTSEEVFNEDTFNLSTLSQFVQGDEGSIVAILQSLIDESVHYKEALLKAMKEDDLVRVGAVCHKMYPMVKLIGSKSLSDNLSYLDQKEPTYTIEDCEHRVKQILDEFEQLILTARDYISSSK